jgi:FKBP-type peptidyl-prolyl cis-trans isomerase
VRKLQLIIIAGTLTLIGFIVAGILLLQNQVAKNDGSQAASSQTQTTDQGGSVEGLQITDEVVGTGAEAVAGKTISVNYLGTLTDGTKFDSSYDRGTPIEFNLGAGQVIKGWDNGFAGMKVGGKRKLVIAPEMGYGNSAVGTIPANSTLVFEVELVGVK